MRKEHFKIIVDRPHRELYTKPNMGRVCCYWCCHPFDHRPVGLPVRYIERKEHFYMQGVYCSWACVNAENRDRPDFRMVQRSGMIYELAKRWHGVIPSRTAPHRLALKMFGGPMTIEEFRNPPDADYMLQTPPVLNIIPDEQILLARTFGPAASIRPSQSNAPLPERQMETMDTTKPKYNVNKVTVAERRKRKRALDLKKMGVNIKS